MAAVTPAGRRIAPVVGTDSWQRCDLRGSVVDARRGEVLLDHDPIVLPGDWPAAPAIPAAGLAFDRGHLYHGDPERGQIQRLRWPRRGGAAPVDLIEGPPPAPEPAGGAGFMSAGTPPARPLLARALAADPDEHLYVLDGGAGGIAVLDLTDGHLLRTVALPGRPLDLAARGRSILVATAGGLFTLDAVGSPRPLPVEDGRLDRVPGDARLTRVAVAPDDTAWLLLRDAGRGAWIVPATGPRLDAPIAIDGATDLEIDGDGRVVAAGPPGAHLRTWTIVDGHAEPGPPLLAGRYDGRGIARTPEGWIACWTAGGPRVAVAPRVTFLTRGTVDTYPLDSLEYRQAWGRLFVEACVPDGADLRVAFATSDESGAEATAFGTPQRLHRRATGRELPWAPLPAGDRFEVYEAPVAAPPGRFLRVRLELAGGVRVTPRLRALRAEFPAHDLLRKLPSAYGRDPASASFLRRYLAMIDGLLTDVERRAVERDLLLDPWAAPVELLPWLGSLIGLTLDDRWPIAARRTLLAEAAALFRSRGTVPGLRRMLEICLDCPVVIVEAFRLRGTGSAMIGGAGPPGPETAIVGLRLRVGGNPEGPDRDPFEVHAHRFSVLIARELDDDRLAVVRDLLEAQRPAHTVVEVCTVGSGMRVGAGLHVELTTIVGPSSGHVPAVVGDGTAGAGTTVGRGRAGIRPGGARLGQGTVIDP
jgi:phage tail-like protein